MSVSDLPRMKESLFADPPTKLGRKLSKTALPALSFGEDKREVNLIKAGQCVETTSLTVRH